VSYKSRRYEKGLEGKKPSELLRDLDSEEGYRAQEAGYRDHLRNRDLAEQIEASRGRDNSYSDGYKTPSRPLTTGQRAFWRILGIIIIVPSWLYYGWSLVDYFQQHPVPSASSLAMACFASVVASIVWSIPGIVCISLSFNKD
jgi:hypothetical protein